MSLTVRYQLTQNQFQLDVDFTIPAQGLTALFGPSGCGKSTVLRCIAGLNEAQSAYLKLNDTIIDHSQDNIKTPTHERSIAYVFQDTVLFPHLNVKNNLLYGYKRRSISSPEINIDSVFKLLRLNELLTRSTRHLSGGEKQRVAIGRALLMGPDLLLMDEPLSALDTASKSEIMPYLEQLHEELKLPVLYVSHSVDEVARLADNLVLMNHGRIQAQGPVNDIFTRLDLAPAYQSNASSIIEAQVISQDEQFCLTRLGFSGGVVTLPYQNLRTGQKARIIIHAKDVSLALEHHENTSILNIFPVTVSEIADETRAKVLVKLDINGQTLISSITRKSASLLDIYPGKSLFAQIKSVALL